MCTYLRHGRGRFDRVAVGLDGGAGPGCVCFFVLAVDLGGRMKIVSKGRKEGNRSSRKSRRKREEGGKRTRSFFEMGMIAARGIRD